MGQRNMHYTYQMPLLESEHGHAHLYPDHCVLHGNAVEYPIQNMHATVPVSGSTADLDLNQVREHNDRNMFYGSSHDIVQNHHLTANVDFVAATSSNSPHQLPTSSSRYFPVSRTDGSFSSSGNQRAIGVSMDEYGRLGYFADIARGSCKRKNAEAIPGNYHVQGPTTSTVASSYLSLDSGQQHWNRTHEASFVDATSFAPPGCGGNDILPIAEGSHRSVRSRSTLPILQPESAILSNNYLVQGNFMGQSIQPASNSWMAQFADVVGDGGYSNWSNTYPVTHLQGRCLSSRDVEMMNRGVQGYRENAFSANSPFLFCPASVPSFHQHLAPVQNLQVPTYGHHTRIPATPYQLPPQNLYPANMNHSLDALESSYRFLPFTSNAELTYRAPWQQFPTAIEVNQRNLRILSPENATVLDISGFYGSGDVIDRHRDMRLDIDGMSYEELLALEEQIGDVSTGLTEESILKNLKTNMHIALSTTSPENETCAVCQVEYEENERQGTLDCGHKYHADCIKQWLLIKNICPICKTSALATDNKKMVEDS